MSGAACPAYSGSRLASSVVLGFKGFAGKPRQAWDGQAMLVTDDAPAISA
jgi:hypothetical protein